MNVRVTKRAQAQIDRAAQWWDENRDLAPEAFDEDLAKAFLLLSAEPALARLCCMPVRKAYGVCISPGFVTISTIASAVVRLKYSPFGIRVAVAGRLCSFSNMTPNPSLNRDASPAALARRPLGASY